MTQMAGDQIVGVDVGGTFTDLIHIGGDGAVRLAKVPSTLTNQADGVMDALQAAQADPAALDLIIHGTTTTTNAVLERKLAKTGLITTQGFRDVLELGRRTRPQAYGMTGTLTPVIPRDLRCEVPERMSAEGKVLTPLDEDALRATAQRLLDQGCTSVVVHFLHAYANPAHELRAGAVLGQIWPNAYVTLCHALLSESREFERGVTGAVNASVQPLLERYLSRLTERLAAEGYRGDLLVMNGNGGTVAASQVVREAAKTVMSGPASGVMAAARIGARAGFPDLLTYDMGGTSTDVAMIRGADPAVSSEIELEYAMPIHVPMVDVRTLGAGGGSIARVNSAGLLEVGPDSAGADPGPICYGKGGTKPTISDANLLLGRLNPEQLAIRGGIALSDVEQVFTDRLGGPLGLSATEAAAAVLQLANIKMAGAVRIVSLSLGQDPRDFALFAFGGAGPLHAAALARELAVPKVLIPARPGITNALGCALADYRHDYVTTLNTPLDRLDPAELARVLADQARMGEATIAKERAAPQTLRHLYALDMQFIGQTHLIRVALDRPDMSRDALQALFEEAYFARFRVHLPEIRAMVVNAAVSVIGTRPPLALDRLIEPEGRKTSLEEAQIGTRQVYFEGIWHETPIYWRDHLPAKVCLIGPAVIEQMDTTVLIEPGNVMRGDSLGNLLIEIPPASAPLSQETAT